MAKQITRANYQSSAKEWKAKRVSSVLEAVSNHLSEKNPRPQLTPIELLELGCVYVNNQRVLDSAYKIKVDDLIRVHSFPRRFQVPSDLLQRITSETQDYLVVDKPQMLPTEPEVDNLAENLQSALRLLVSPNLFPVFTVDIDTRGLVVFAKSEAKAEEYKQKFKAGEVTRTFVAFTEKPIAESTSDIKVLSCTALDSATNVINEARYSWSTPPGLGPIYRVEIELINGRPLDIREFLAEQGAPVLGDLKRGSDKEIKEFDTSKPSLAFCPISIRF